MKIIQSTPKDPVEDLREQLSRLGINPDNAKEHVIRNTLRDLDSSGVTHCWLNTFVTQDDYLKDVLTAVEDLALNPDFQDSPVLILGPTGVGKEILARALHGRRGEIKEDGRPDMSAFVAFNCSAVTETLAESELFGHEQGSFTDAKQKRLGLMRAAEQGTLFLDEVGDLPLPIQAKLLRALQEREVRPVGSDKSYPIDCRIVAATRKDLHDLMAHDLFRPDLYGRLMAFEFYITGLQERIKDVDFLFRSLGSPLTYDDLDTKSKDLISAYNVRAVQALALRYKAWKSLSFRTV